MNNYHPTTQVLTDHKHSLTKLPQKQRKTTYIKRSSTQSNLRNQEKYRYEHRKIYTNNQEVIEEQPRQNKIDRRSMTIGDFKRASSLETGIRYRKNGQENNRHKRISTELKEIQIKQERKSMAPDQIVKQKTKEQNNKKSSKLLQRIPDHRRIRSSSKISSKLIQVNQFFRQDQNNKNKNKIRKVYEQMQNQRKQTEEALQNMLQLKLKTQSSISNLNDLTSFRNSIYSKNSRVSAFSIGSKVHSHKKSKLSDLMSKQEINTSKQLIKQTQQMRKTNNLRPNPKQWQFHNCLILQKIQLYSTNLRISCEGWVVLDHLQLKYLRGWNPKTEDDFSPIVRLFVAKIAFDLPKIAKFKLDIDKILIRVNDKHIYQDEREKRKQKSEKLKGIAPHTILSLNKLVTAMLITKHQDLIVHSVLAIGYILKLIHENQNKPQKYHNPLHEIHHQSQYFIFIKSSQKCHLQQFCEYFERECSNICSQLDLLSTKVIIGFSCLFKDFAKSLKNKNIKINHHQYTVSSTPLDVSILFMKLLSYKQFKQALSYRIYEAQVRYQVGWNFWESRALKWVNQQYVKYRLKTIGGRNNKGNQCYVVWDDQRDIVVAMADCKVNMHFKDTERIQEWVQKHIARFSNKYCLNMTFYPADTEKFHKIN